MKNLINKEVQLSKKIISSKFLKTCFVGCLATCLTLTGIFAFAPLGASAQTNQNTNLNNNLNNSTTSTTESTGLITPRADDPVLFTTENGLEIKYANVTFQGSISSGGLTKFPYFTTNNGTKDYTWVIIGTWPILTDSSVAGVDIKSDQNYNLSRLWGSLTKIAENPEIPDYCVLVFANEIVATGRADDWRNSPPVLTLTSAMEGYYTNGSFGLSAVKDSILLTHLVTCAHNNATYVDASGDYHIFPLACRATNFVNTSIPVNFVYDSYLTYTQAKTSNDYWLREYGYSSWYMSSTGSASTATFTNSYGYRPAFVMSLF